MNEQNRDDEYGAKDNTGLDEIQKALDEINKLNLESTNEDEPEDEVVQSEKEVDVEGEAKDEPEDEIVPVKEEKKPSKIWKEKKRKYQAIAEKEALRVENEQLKQMLSESLNSGTYHYSKSAYADLEKAKDNQKKAIEDGDLESLVEAQVSLTKAVNAINDLEKWSYNEEQRRPQEPVNNNQTYYVSEQEQEIVKDWLEDHQYLEPSSRNYDAKIATKVADFVNALDTNLTNNRNREALFSEEYFDTIDNYISKIKRDSGKNTKSLDAIAPVGAVRNSYTSSPSTSGSRPTQMILTADEKKMCVNAGITEKEWLKYKIEDLKKGK